MKGKLNFRKYNTIEKAVNIPKDAIFLDVIFSFLPLIIYITATITNNAIIVSNITNNLLFVNNSIKFKTILPPKKMCP